MTEQTMNFGDEIIPNIKDGWLISRDLPLVWMIPQSHEQYSHQGSLEQFPWLTLAQSQLRFSRWWKLGEASDTE